jgi:hypothetical protein
LDRKGWVHLLVVRKVFLREGNYYLGLGGNNCKSPPPGFLREGKEEPGFEGRVNFLMGVLWGGEGGIVLGNPPPPTVSS